MFGPDTAELLLRISTIEYETLDVAGLRLTSFPALPETLKVLICYNTQLSVLPKLPEKLKTLFCNNTQLSVLPDLPKTLTNLYCGYTQLSVLPKLPKALSVLHCSHTHLYAFPKLPKTLAVLWCDNTPLKIQRIDDESDADYCKRCNNYWRAEQVCIRRCKEKCQAIKDELFAATEY